MVGMIRFESVILACKSLKKLDQFLLVYFNKLFSYQSVYVYPNYYKFIGLNYFYIQFQSYYQTLSLSKINFLNHI